VRISTKSIASALAAIGLIAAVASGSQASAGTDTSAARRAAPAATDDSGAQPAVNYPKCAVNITPAGLIGRPIWVPSKTAAYTADARRCVLSTAYGSKLTGTYRLQLALTRCYDRSTAEDGYYGTDTRNTVISVQQQLKLSSQDGVYGPATHNAMKFYGPDGKCDWDKVKIA
jgi:peptidoglycan hydrolase-like protein with peptidoglycan-binding domain